MVVADVHTSFYPETLRSIVGDGSIPPPALNASPIAIYQTRKHKAELKAAGIEEEPVERPPPKKVSFVCPHRQADIQYQPLSAFMILFVPEVFLIFIVVSFPYLNFYCLLTVFSTALKDTYGLNELQIGLCYL